MAVELNATLENLYQLAQQALEGNRHGDKAVLLKSVDGEIAPGAWQRLGSRDSAFKEATKRARETLLQALCQELHGLGLSGTRFPKAILDALKLDDFVLNANGEVTSHHPLTARRVICITQAVKNLKQAMTDLASASVDAGLEAFRASGLPDTLAPHAFTPEDVRSMKELVMRDLMRRKSEGLPVPTQDQIVASFARGSNHALAVTLNAHQLFANHLPIPDTLTVMQQMGDYATAPSLDAKVRRDRQDLLSFVQLMEPSPAHNDAQRLATAVLLFEKRDEMRRLQPTGTLRFDTAWRACFGEKMPARLAQADDAARLTALLARVCRHTAEQYRLQTEQANRAGLNVPADRALGEILSDLVLAFGGGLSHSAALRLQTQGSQFALQPGDMIAPRSAYCPADALHQETATRQRMIAQDFARQAVTVRVGDETTDFAGLSVDDDDAIARIAALEARVDGLVGEGHEAQKAVVKILLGQAGTVPFTMFGRGMEHSDLDVQLSRRDDGTVVMRFASAPYAKEDIHYEIHVAPDGRNFTTNVTAARRAEGAFLRPGGRLNAALGELEARALQLFGTRLVAALDGAQPPLSNAARESLASWVAQKGADSFTRSCVSRFAARLAAAPDQAARDAVIRAFLAATADRLEVRLFGDMRAHVLADKQSELLVNGPAWLRTTKGKALLAEELGRLPIEQAIALTRVEDLPGFAHLFAEVAAADAAQRFVADHADVLPGGEGAKAFIAKAVAAAVEHELAHEAHPRTPEQILASLREGRDPALALALLARGLLSNAASALSPELASLNGQEAVIGGRTEAEQIDVITLLSLVERQRPRQEGMPYFMGIGSDSIGLMYLRDGLVRLREVKPEGPITEQDVRTVLFGGRADAPLFNCALDAVNARNAELFEQFHAQLEEPVAEPYQALGKLVAIKLTAGFRLEAAFALAYGFEDFVFDPARDMASAPELYNAQNALAYERSGGLLSQIAGDLVRMRGNVDFLDAEGRAVGERLNLCGVRAGFVDVEQTAQAAHDRFTAFLQDCPPVQQAVALTALIQSSQTFCRAFGSEHSDVDITVKREAGGSLLVTFKAMANHPYDLSYAYRIAPDGSSTQCDAHVTKKPPEVVAETTRRLNEARTALVARADQAFKARFNEKLALLENPDERRYFQRMQERGSATFAETAAHAFEVAYATAQNDGEREALLVDFDRYVEGGLALQLTDPHADVDRYVTDSIKKYLIGFEGTITNRTRRDVTDYLYRMTPPQRLAVLQALETERARVLAERNIQLKEVITPALSATLIPILALERLQRDYPVD